MLLGPGDFHEAADAGLHLQKQRAEDDFPSNPDASPTKPTGSCLTGGRAQSKHCGGADAVRAS